MTPTSRLVSVALLVLAGCGSPVPETPAASPVLTTAPLAAAAPVYVTDLTPVSSTNGWGPIEKDRSNGEQAAGDGLTLSLNGTTYARGLGVHAESEVVYALGGAYSRFQATVGVDDEVGSLGSVVFRVVADGTTLFQSATLTGGSAAQAVDVDVSGRQQLKLMVSGAGDGIGSDHADWADARLVPLRNAYQRIEAESLDSHLGISVNTVDIGTIQTGDWARYAGVSFGTGGATRVVLRLGVPSGFAGKRLEVRLGSPTGTLLGTLTTQSTGDWTSYTDQSVAIPSTTGTHDVYIVGAGEHVCNLDAFWFIGNPGRDAFADIQAESLDGHSGVAVDTGHVGELELNDWAKYAAVNFGATGADRVIMSVGVPASFAGGQLEVRLGSPTGTAIGRLTLQSTGAWTTYVEQAAAVTPTTGTHDVYLVVVGGNHIANLNAFRFAKSAIWNPGDFFPGSEAGRSGVSVDFATHGRVRVAFGGRKFEHESGRPFFWLGDTAWRMFHSLSLSEAETWLENRRSRGYTVIQAVVLNEHRGLSVANRQGHYVLDGVISGDSLCNGAHRPNPVYMSHIASIIDLGARKGLMFAVLPAWGNYVQLTWGSLKDAQLFTPTYLQQGQAEAERKAWCWGREMGRLFGAKKNVMFMIGGDRGVDDYEKPIWTKMAEGVQAGAPPGALLTFHPCGFATLCGDRSSAPWYHGSAWLDFNSIQSGHHARDYPNYNLITKAYNYAPAKPVIESEPRYEDAQVDYDSANGYFDEYDARTAAYWALFAGAAGHTFGHQTLWQVADPQNPVWQSLGWGSPAQVARWQDALNQPGSVDMMHLRKLYDSRNFQSTFPDQAMIASDPSSSYSRLQAVRGDGFSWVYFSNGRTARIRLGRVNGAAGARIDAWWMSPRDGSVRYIGRLANTDQDFTPPNTSTGRHNDWVLWLDDASRGFPRPMQ